MRVWRGAWQAASPSGAAWPARTDATESGVEFAGMGRFRASVIFLIAAAVPALALDPPLSEAFAAQQAVAFKAAEAVAQRTFLTVRVDPKSCMIEFDQMQGVQEVKGKIVVQQAAGASLVSVVTSLVDPPPRPKHLTAPTENGREAQKRAETDALLQNLGNSIQYSARLHAGGTLEREFMRALEKVLMPIRSGKGHRRPA